MRRIFELLARIRSARIGGVVHEVKRQCFGCKRERQNRNLCADCLFVLQILVAVAIVFACAIAAMIMLSYGVLGSA